MSVVLVLAESWHDQMMGGDGASWWWVSASLVLVAVLALVVVLVVRLASPDGRPEPRDDEARTARVIAMGRYARGEIGADEYDALVQRLR